MNVKVCHDESAWFWQLRRNNTAVKITRNCFI